jgi:hypothetical protein
MRRSPETKGRSDISVRQRYVVAVCFLGHTNLGHFMPDRHHMQA